MSAWVDISVFIAVVAVMAGALWVERRFAKGESSKAASEAQARMAGHRDSSASTSTDRMSDGHFQRGGRRRLGGGRVLGLQGCQEG